MGDMGKIAYEAFCSKAVAHRDTVMQCSRSWDQLSEAERVAWRYAAKAVCDLFGPVVE